MDTPTIPDRYSVVRRNNAFGSSRLDRTDVECV
jgi:hypothetical protein